MLNRETKEPEALICSPAAVSFATSARLPPYLIVTATSALWANIPQGDARFRKLCAAARRCRGKWTGSNWEFSTEAQVRKVVDLATRLGITRHYPDWAAVEAAQLDELKQARHAFPPLNAVVLPGGGMMLRQVPGTADLLKVLHTAGADYSARAVAHVSNGRPAEATQLILTIPADRVQETTSAVREAGYRIEPARRAAASAAPVRVERDGWFLCVCLPVQERPWLSTLCPDSFQWEGCYPNGWRVYDQTPIVKGEAAPECSIAEWPQLREQIEKLEGRAPELPGEFTDSQLIARFARKPAGWDSPAPNGCRLHPYQREGVLFAMQRAGRCMIADEMGVGKTAQAIATAQALGARRVLVVAPANVRHVWDREIHGWLNGDATVRHIQSSTDRIDPDANTRCDGSWLIATYDQLIARREVWRCADEDERRVVWSWLQSHDLLDHRDDDEGNEDEGDREGHRRRSSVSNGDRIIIPPSAVAIADAPILPAARMRTWQRIIRRLRGRLLTDIEIWRPDLLIIDEAHRAKNSEAKRTQSLARLSEGAGGVLLLTGTPIRNHAREPVNLMRLIDPRAYRHLTHHLHDRDRIKKVLKYLQIRRLKRDVLPQLPPQIREMLPVSVKVSDEYLEALDDALRERRDALKAGGTEQEARRAMLPGLARARRALGQAKVGVASELVAQVVEQNERACCVVFCAHHTVSDGLARALRVVGLRVTTLDGRTAAESRGPIVDQFQDGQIDVLICGVQAAGEGITLHRADTVVFVEQDWVPGVVQQAEARIHRLGQTAEHCWTYHVVVDESCLPADTNLDSMLWKALGSKLNVINDLLDENAQLAAGGEGHSGSVRDAVIDRLLHGRGQATSNSTARPATPDGTQSAPAAAQKKPLVRAGSKKRRRTAKISVTNTSKAPTKQRRAAKWEARHEDLVRRQTRERVRRLRAKNPDAYREYMRDLMRRLRAGARADPSLHSGRRPTRRT